MKTSHVVLAQSVPSIKIKTFGSQWKAVSFVVLFFALVLSPPNINAREWVTFIQAGIKCDNRDTLTIFNDGSWSYVTDGGQSPYGLCDGNSTSGSSFSCMQNFNPFPSPAAIDNDLTKWSATVISGSAPRCPNIGYGSNPNSTVSVIAHTADYVQVYMRDDGSCGSQGRVDFTLQLQYFRPVLPAITQQPLPGTNIIAAGGTFALTAAASGDSLQYQWRQNGTNISGATNSSLQISGIGSRHQGSYDIVVTNYSGSVTSSIATLALIPPEIELHIKLITPQTVRVSWPSVLNAQHQLISGTELLQLGSFLPVGSLTNGTGAEFEVLLPVSTTEAQFYRLQTFY